MKIILFALLLIRNVAFSQSLFKPIAKPTAPRQIAMAFSPNSTTPSPDSTFTGFRFTGPSVLYAFPNSTVFTGIGVSYEHDTYQPTTGKFYTNWSVTVAGYAGGQFAPSSVSGVTAVGLSVGFFNKLVTLGVLYNLTTSKVMGAVGPTVSLNN